MTPGGGRGWFHRKRPHQTVAPVEDANGIAGPSGNSQPTVQQGSVDARDLVPSAAAAVDMNRASIQEPIASDELASVELGSAEFASEVRASDELEQPGRSPQASSSGIDWDAATAAALADDPVESESTPLAVEHALGADRLLEDLIREIVGDAAVDTATALQTAPVAVHAPVESPSPTAEAHGESTPVITENDGQSDGHRGGPVVGEVQTEAAPHAETSPASPEQITMQPAEAVVAPPTATPDVSRETSLDHGGTPLAYELADETRRRVALEESVLPLPPATRVLTISNQKGGVGKTTTAVNLAAALARSGAKVLVIDLDPQGNASTALGVDHRSEQKSVYEVLVADLPLTEVIRPSTEHERLDCVPATIHLAGAEIELVSLVAREQRLRRALDRHLATMDRAYDYVFIDCPPSLGLLTINAFVAAREVLIPIQCEYYALEGLSQLLSNIELIEKHLNPELRLSTILLTMYDSRTNLAQQVAQEVRDHFPIQTLQTIIPRSVRVSEAPSYGQSVISYDFASSGSLSYREAAAEIARRGAATPEESN